MTTLLLAVVLLGQADVSATMWDPTAEDTIEALAREYDSKRLRDLVRWNRLPPNKVDDNDFEEAPAWDPTEKAARTGVRANPRGNDFTPPTRTRDGWDPRITDGVVKQSSGPASAGDASRKGGPSFFIIIIMIILLGAAARRKR